MLTVGSLFAGIGGFDLGLERAGMRVIWQSEIDPYASAVLRRHWPAVPNLGDIRRIVVDQGRTSTHPYQRLLVAPWGICAGGQVSGPFGAPDVLCGGFPCQDISNAGKRAGIDGERSGLWSEFARLIGELRPRYAIMENVAALLGRGLERVLGDLAEIGYDAEWHCIPASAVGAPHRRDRVWIVAYPGGQQHEGGCAANERAPAEGLYERMADTVQPNGTNGEQGWGMLAAGDWWAVEPDVGRVAHGVPRRVDRLRCLGNAIVPQVAEIIGRAIVQRDTEEK